MSEPTSVQSAAVQRAIVLLNAAKVEYAIRTPEGEMLGTLEVKPRKPVKERKWTVVNDFTKMFPGYADQVRAMQPGDVLRWPCKDKVQAEQFRASVASQASRGLGPGKSMTTITADHTVELLRVE